MPKSYEPSPEHPLTPACPYFPPEEQAWLQGEFREILHARLSMGPRVREFEGKFAAYCGTTFAVAVPSCSAALELEGSAATRDRKSTRLNSSHANISYAVFCLKKKNAKT